jgi:hypothetical protein
MRIIRLAEHPDHLIEKFGSSGFHLGHIGRDVHSIIVRIEPYGRIGRHPTEKSQLLMPLIGSALASGDDSVVAEIHPGEAVLWSDGESHETTTESGLLAVVLDGAGIAESLIHDE